MIAHLGTAAVAPLLVALEPLCFSRGSGQLMGSTQTMDWARLLS